MMNEIHAGLHVRYMEERIEVGKCPYCGSKDYRFGRKEGLFSIVTEYFHCMECGREFVEFPIETFEEWAERNDIYLEEL